LVSNVHSRTYHEDGNASAYQDKGQRHAAWNERPPKEISNGVQHRVEQVQKQRWQRKNENHKLYKKRHTVS